MIRTFISKNNVDIALSLLLAVFTGLIFYYPNYNIEKKISSDEIISRNFIYSPLTAKRISPVQDELKYAAYIRKVMDGNLCIGDPDIYERRNQITPANKLPYIVAGIFSRWLGSVNQFFVLSDFVLPFFSIIIGYFFLRLFLENRLIAFWGIIILFSMYSFSRLFSMDMFLFEFESLFKNTDNYRAAFNVYALKYPSYQLIFPFTFLYYYSCYKLLLRNNNLYLVIVGILAGLSAYIYIYSYLTLGLQLLFLMIWTFFQGKRTLSLRFLVSGILALLISSFYIKNLLIFNSNPDHVFKSMAAYVTKSVDYNIAFIAFKFMFFTLVILYLLWRIHFLWSKAAFLLSIMVSTLSLMVLSIVVFFIPQTQHFFIFEARIVGILSLLFLISVVFRKEQRKLLVPKRLFNWCAERRKLNVSIKILVIAVIVLHSCQVMASEWYYLHKKSSLYYPKYTINKNFMEAYDWLDKNVSNESTILSIDEQQISLIPIFTGCYVYIPDDFISMSPGYEVWKRVKQGFGFYGVNKPILKSILKGYELPYEYKEEMMDSRTGKIYDLEESQDAYVEYRKKWFPYIVFSHFVFDSKSLSFQYYNRYLSELELNRIEYNEKGKSYFQGINFIPSNLIKEQLADYESESGNIDLLKFKVDYIWFGPLEKDLTGLSEIESDRLKLVFQNKVVKLYKVE